ncbi:hypothetical protein, partial [Pseudomonas viridiflava]|uniref:hypothetical protein n=1 Tax=Pseudomonas viridiflava TaxID=33069 RepID=UPI00197D2C63
TNPITTTTQARSQAERIAQTPIKNVGNVSKKAGITRRAAQHTSAIKRPPVTLDWLSLPAKVVPWASIH